MKMKLDSIMLGPAEKRLRDLPDESVGMIVTSPPYNLKNSTGNGLKHPGCGRWKNAALNDGYADHDDNMPHGEYVEWQRDCVSQMLRVLRPQGAIFYNHKMRVQGGELQNYAAEILAGFPVRQMIVWQRSGGFNFNPGYFVPTTEQIWLIPKSKAFKLAKGANALGDVWSVQQERGNDHPAPFPIELAERAIKSVPDVGPVLDPFMGSGTTAVAAERLGRHWIGIEVSKKYARAARKRIKEERISQ